MPTIATDTKAVDSRSRGPGRGTADSQTSPGEQAFGGVLSSLADETGGTATGPGKTAAAGSIVRTNLPTLDIAAATTGEATQTQDGGAAISILVGKIIAKSASSSDPTAKTEKTKDDPPVSPSDAPTIASAIVPTDLAALLATPIRVPSPEHSANPTLKTSGPTAGVRSSSTIDPAPTPQAAPTREDAAPTIDKVSVTTTLAPWTEASNGAAITPSAESTASDVSNIAQFTMAGPVQTIADAISDLASSAPASAAAEPAANPAAVGVAPARTMTLQLTPADLGTVAVRLHLTGNTLDVSLSISEPRTLGLLDRERDALSTALGNQSYQLHSLVIQGADASASSSGGNNAGQDDRNGTTRGNAGSNGDGSGHGERQDQSRSQARPRAVAGSSGGARGGRSDQLFV